MKHYNPCPICDNNNPSPYAIYKDMQIFKCNICTFMYQDIESASFNNHHIIKEIYKEYILKDDCHNHLNIQRLKRINKSFKNSIKDKKILEIGTGNGTLASLLIKEGALYTGIEKLDICYNKAIHLYPNLKQHIIHSNCYDTNFPEHSFDLVILVDTFEHIKHPKQLLIKIKKLLKKTGKLYIEVPNESYLKAKAKLRSLFKMYNGYPTNPEHISMFTPQTFTKLLKQTNFKINMLYQKTIWGDFDRMKIALNNNGSFWLQIICHFFLFTKIDILLQQGILISISEND